jgi:hypothetical protein
MEAAFSSKTSEHYSTTQLRSQRKAARSVVFEERGRREYLDMRGNEWSLVNCMLACP